MPVSIEVNKRHEKFIHDVYSLVGEEYTVLGLYKNNLTKIEMRHNRCGHVWLALPKNFLQGTRCPKCKANSFKGTDRFKKQVYELVGDEYEVLSEYKGAHERIQLRHNKCGREYTTSPNSFLKGGRCVKCRDKERAERQRKSHEQFCQEVENLGNGEYEVVGKYVSAKTKVKILHKDCGHVFPVKPNSFLCGSRCPKCKESKGEKAISECLTKMGLVFDRQVKIDGCANDRSLIFDFAVYNDKGEIDCLIEFDGEFHFIEIFDDSLSKQRLRDSIKNKFCKDNGIRLIRIPYWDIENIGILLGFMLSKGE